MEITIFLPRLSVFAHSLFWWLLALALLFKASWLPLVLVAVLILETLLLSVSAFKGLGAIGITRSANKDQAVTDSPNEPLIKRYL